MRSVRKLKAECATARYIFYDFDVPQHILTRLRFQMLSSILSLCTRRSKNKAKSFVIETYQAFCTCESCQILDITKTHAECLLFSTPKADAISRLTEVERTTLMHGVLYLRNRNMPQNVMHAKFL